MQYRVAIMLVDYRVTQQAFVDMNLKVVFIPHS